MKLICVCIIKIYQNTLGLYLGGNCRFSPTCSEYMLLAIQRDGVFAGMSKGLRRLLRCHPYSKHQGIDNI